MKNTIIIILLLLLAGLLASSCSITKRRYMPGYYVHNSMKTKSANNTRETDKIPEARQASQATTMQVNPVQIPGDITSKATEVDNVNKKVKDNNVQLNIPKKKVNSGISIKPHPALLQHAVNPSLLQCHQNPEIKHLIQQEPDDGNSG